MNTVEVKFQLSEELFERLQEYAEDLHRTPDEQARLFVEDALTPREMGEK